jgi:hypothetical protein
MPAEKIGAPWSGLERSVVEARAAEPLNSGRRVPIQV